MDSRGGWFGFLPIQRTISFSGVSLVLLDNYQEVEGAVRAAANADGFVYPPLEKRMRAQPKFHDGKVLPKDQWDWEEVPKTERPAHLHRLPASHELRLERSPIDNDLRKNDGAFLMYLAGYLFGYRLQFYDWWFVSLCGGRVGPLAMPTRVDPAKMPSEYRPWRPGSASLAQSHLC